MQTTLKSRTIFCRDNLEIMRGINSNSIDLIYLDPPFNKGKQFHAPIGTTAEGADFKDIWSPDEVKDEWHNELNDSYPKLYKYFDAVEGIGSNSAKYYLIYMGVRLIETYRILKDTGSIYLHCDPTSSHYLKLLMDSIFGHGSIRNEIIWRIGWVSGYKTRKIGFIRNHDVILYYVKSKTFTFNKEYVPYADGYTRRDGKAPTGKGIPIEDTWNCSNGDILDSIGIKSFAKKTGYPTEKPIPLLERIISASSNKDDLVLDPFCGCATACIAAERKERRWLGIDVGAKAYELVKGRLKEEVPPTLFNPDKPIFRTDIPARTDLNGKKGPLPQDKVSLYGEQGGHCKGCGTHFKIQHFQIDHIIPQAHGGSHEINNLQLLCANCNSIKGKKPMEYLKARLKQLYG